MVAKRSETWTDIQEGIIIPICWHLDHMKIKLKNLNGQHPLMFEHLPKFEYWQRMFECRYLNECSIQTLACSNISGRSTTGHCRQIGTIIRSPDIRHRRSVKEKYNGKNQGLPSSVCGAIANLSFFNIINFRWSDFTIFLYLQSSAGFYERLSE